MLLVSFCGCIQPFRSFHLCYLSLEIPNPSPFALPFLLYLQYDHRQEHGNKGAGGTSRHSDRLGVLKRNASGQASAGRDHLSSSPPESSIYAAHFTETERRIAHFSPNDSVGGAQFKSPQEILATSGSVEAVKERNVTNSLLDFFGM